MITVSCSSCGQDVKRLVPPTASVLCTECCTPSDDEVHHQLLADAQRRVECQLRAFDTAGSYDTAALSMTDTATLWQRKSIAAVADHQRRLARNEPGRGGILFTGPTGIGKTYAGIAILRRVAQFDPSGIRVMTESSLLRPGIAPWELHDHIRRMLHSARTMLIDDVGTVARPQDQVMMAWKLAADLIAASPTSVLLIATTNLPDMDRLSAWIGAQATSRLAGFVEQATTGWTDRRAGVDHAEWKARLQNSRPRAASA